MMKTFQVFFWSSDLKNKYYLAVGNERQEEIKNNPERK